VRKKKKQVNKNTRGPVKGMSAEIPFREIKSLNASVEGRARPRYGPGDVRRESVGLVQSMLGKGAIHFPFKREGAKAKRKRIKYRKAFRVTRYGGIGQGLLATWYWES